VIHSWNKITREFCAFYVPVQCNASVSVCSCSGVRIGKNVLCCRTERDFSCLGFRDEDENKMEISEIDVSFRVKSHSCLGLSNFAELRISMLRGIYIKYIIEQYRNYV
jgi:hypothetical protein